MMTALRPQQWFEMRELRTRELARAAWIPLKEEKAIHREGTFGHVGFVEEYSRVATVAIPRDQCAAAERLAWEHIFSFHSTRGYLDQDGYVPAHAFRNTAPDVTGEWLVLERAGTDFEASEWLLNHDLAVTMGLKREGEVWRAIARGYEDVIRGEAGPDNERGLVSLQIQPLYLRDYLCARDMRLLVASFRSRKQVVEDASAHTVAGGCL